MNILLIGGTGVLSSAVTTEALKQGIYVTMINRGNNAIPDGVEWIKANKNDKEAIAIKLKGRIFDAICDFLIYTSQQLIDSYTFYAPYCKQYVFISSAAVIDTRIGGVLTEKSKKVLPIWNYSVEKWNCEQKLTDLFRQQGTPYTIVRPCVTYGNTRIPYGIYPPYGYHWTFVARILTGKPIIRWNKGENRCSMLRVEDFAIGLVGLFGNSKTYGEAYNICGDEAPSWNDVLNALQEALGTKVKTIDIDSDFYAQEIPDRKGEIIGGRSIDAIHSNAKIKALVPDFKQTIFLKDGIKKTLDAYKEQNYQKGIDWQFDAETDRIIAKWCKQHSISTNNFHIGFTNYLGTASIKDRITYYKRFYQNNQLKLSYWKIINRIYKLLR